jgi:nucleoside-diphosphate-sugar epimerase
MRVFITGSGGMLGSAVYPAFVRAGHEVTATDLVPRPAAGAPMGQLDVRDRT